MTTYKLRISSWIADEVVNRQLHVYGSAFVKITEAYEHNPRSKFYTLAFTADEVNQIKAEAEMGASPDNGWDGSLRVPFKALLRQIAKVA
jgi:hypothetical protein